MHMDILPAKRNRLPARIDSEDESFIMPGVDIPERIIPDLELRRQNGERGARKFVAYAGIVYDVTDCPKWRLDLHENLHFPGQDLTSELPDAPHEEDVFTRPCVKVVGRLGQ